MELWAKYSGRLSEIWFDGGDDLPGVNAALARCVRVCNRVFAGLDGFLRSRMGRRRARARYQPQAVYFGGSMPYNNLRWVGTESGEPGYPVWSNADPGENGGGRPDGSEFAPAESDTTLSAFDEWFWKPAYFYRSLDDLKARARGGGGLTCQACRRCTMRLWARTRTCC